MAHRPCSPKSTRNRGARALLGLGLALLAGALLCAPALAQTRPAAPARPAPPSAPSGNSLFVTVGKSSLIDLPYSLGRISVTNPDIADGLVIGPNQVLVNGKKAGITNLILWSQDNRSVIYDVVVQGDIEVLAAKLRALLPKESFRVLPAQDSLILSGTTESPEARETAAKVAEAFAPQKVVNLIRVDRDPPQVSLKVHFAEVRAQAIKKLGFQFQSFGGKRITGVRDLLIAPRETVEGTPFGGIAGTVGGTITTSLSSAVNFFITDSARDIGILIQGLKENGDLQTLAEPRLVAISGKKASFLAGGEIPVPIPQAEGNITIVYKPFGIKLDFQPTVREDGRIELELTPEVSAIDRVNAVVLQGFSIPALTTRRASTKVELRSGQSFAIAGLIDNSISDTISKIPLLGDLPILGALFRSKSFSRRETELLVIVTPELARPAGPEEPLAQRPGFALGRGK